MYPKITKKVIKNAENAFLKSPITRKSLVFEKGKSKKENKSKAELPKP